MEIIVRNEIATIKARGAKKHISGNMQRLENLKKTASEGAKKILSRMQREIRRSKKVEAKKIDLDDARAFYKLVNTNSEDLKIMLYENCASKSNGKEYKTGNKNLNSFNKEIKIKGIA